MTERDTRVSPVKTAIAGIGSCASSFVQSVAMARNPDITCPGIMFEEIGGRRVEDIEFVAAFDVDKEKNGLELADVIQAPLTSAKLHAEVAPTGVTVEAGPLLDGTDGPLAGVIAIDPETQYADQAMISRRLRDCEADVLVCLLPAGSTGAVQLYARAAAEAGASFVNATPEPVAVDRAMARLFRSRNAALLGDDLRSHVGATTVHTALIELLRSRGVEIVNTYQLNIGGNTDFMNLADPVRSSGKRRTKRNALASAGIDASDVAAGPNGYVKFLGDVKVCIIRIEAESVLGSPLTLDLRLQVEDSPNAAGVLMSAVRIAKLASERQHYGVIEAACPALFKNPPHGATESIGLEMLRRYIISSADTAAR